MAKTKMQLIAHGFSRYWKPTRCIGGNFYTRIDDRWHQLKWDDRRALFITNGFTLSDRQMNYLTHY